MIVKEELDSFRLSWLLAIMLGRHRSAYSLYVLEYWGGGVWKYCKAHPDLYIFLDSIWLVTMCNHLV